MSAHDCRSDNRWDKGTVRWSRATVLGFKASIIKYLYKYGPSIRLAERCGAFDECEIPRLELLLALAECLDDLEKRHANN